jgi:hypothetical protein
MLKQIKSYLTSNEIINKFQYGFVEKSSTISATSDLLDFIITSKDANYNVLCIFIDLRKAFDVVDHNILLRKLEKIGFERSALNLMDSYLSNRQQFVEVGSSRSAVGVNLYGVPQGSLLGPTLFNIFINDIFKLNLNGSIQLYADDAVLKYRSRDLAVLHESIQHDLRLLSDWFSANLLSVNESKTVYMTFSKQPFDLNIFWNNTILKRMFAVKYLGLYIDADLKWRTHLLTVKTKLNSVLFALRRTRKFLNDHTAWLIYHSHVHSHLSYMCSMYGSANKTDIAPIQRIQNRILKVIRKLPFLTPSILLYSDKILPVRGVFCFELMFFIYKVRKKLIKSNVLLYTNSTFHTYATRTRDNFRIPFSSSNICQKSVFRLGLKLFNLLPETIKNQDCINIFKKESKSYVYHNLDRLENLTYN